VCGATAAGVRYTWIDGKEARNVPADIVHEDNSAFARVARKTTPAAALTALGIVYGDLGTSPLYTLQAVVGATGGNFSREAALGSLSLIFWALIISISVKYCLFVMRADNHGEGGILALMSMTGANWSKGRRILIVMGLFGAALIYGDGIITPAISVLSALEGLNVATDVFKPHVVSMAVAILVALFAIQSRGTAQIAKAFRPVMLLWFAVIAALGIAGISRYPAVIAAVDPRYGVALLTGHGWSGIAVLGGVFLAMTGAEAMYADMGHIGRNPIRTSWYGIVLPALLLNYTGQVALFLDDPAVQGNPFFPAGAVMVDLSARGACHCCYDHRQSGHHHWIVLADPSGDAARLVPGRSDPPDLLGRIWADLRAVCELDDDGSDTCAHHQLRQLGSPSGCLWHRGFDYHAADDRAALQRYAQALALAGCTGANRKRPLSRCRFCVLRGQSVQDPGGWLDTAHVRHAGVLRHGLMALRLRGPARAPYSAGGEPG
jgi:K+ potassium transporter